jgi:phenylacetate-CoA ligase
MQKLKTILYERVLYPIYQLRYGPYGIKIIKVFKYLNQSQWWSRDKLRAYQNEKLRRLIEHVYHNVPYYHDVMRSKGIQPQDICSVDDLKYFPILIKKVIKANFKEIMSKDINKRSVIKFSTSGTTGDPLTVLVDRDSRIWAEAARLRGWSWANYEVGNSIINFSSHKWPSMLGKIRIGLINIHEFPEFAEKDELIHYFSKIRKLKPFCLTGLTSNLCRIAAIYDKYNVNGIQFPVIFSTAEMLHEHQRDLLEKLFKSKVYDYYGSTEIGSLAYECEYNNKHITDEHVIIETMNSQGANVSNTCGDIILTDLDNYAMPFIRYKCGDVGTLTGSECECRRGLHILKSLDGRSQEFLKTLDGNCVSAMYFPSRFKKVKGIEQYQIVQPDINHITLKIVKNKFFSSNELEKMIQIIKEKIGNDVNISVEECDRIPLTTRGKMQLVISHLLTEF